VAVDVGVGKNALARLVVAVDWKDGAVTIPIPKSVKPAVNDRSRDQRFEFITYANITQL
jgi:hypothetical protein